MGASREHLRLGRVSAGSRQRPTPAAAHGTTTRTSAKRIVDATLVALGEKYKGRLRTRGNILIGFSEGAFIAQQIGMRDPVHFSRWLILAANDRYWFGDAPQLLEQNHRRSGACT